VNRVQSRRVRTKHKAVVNMHDVTLAIEKYVSVMSVTKEWIEDRLVWASHRAYLSLSCSI
jgi:hypothetical protein